MSEFCVFCMIVAFIASLFIFWEFYAIVGSLLILYVCGYLLVSQFRPEIDINYRLAAEQYIIVGEQIDELEEGSGEREKLTKQRDELKDKMVTWITDKELWKKYDKENQQNGIELAMTNRVAKSVEDVRRKERTRRWK